MSVTKELEQQQQQQQQQRQQRQQQLPVSPSAVSLSPGQAVASAGTGDVSSWTEELDPPSIIARRPVRYVGATTTQIDSSVWNLCDPQGRPDVDEGGADAIAFAGLQGSFCRLGRSDRFLVQADGDHRQGYHHCAARRWLRDVEDVVAPCGPILIELYMAFVHPHFPVLEARDFVSRHRRSPSDTPPALLAAVYLLGLSWWDTDVRVRGRALPDVGSLEDLAFRCLDWALQRPDLSAVQAGLLMLQRSEGETWAMTARLVAVGQDLGLHLDPSAWDEVPPWERALRKRVAWALFVQDKWGALVHGRPSHLVRANWAVGILVDEDFEPDLPPLDLHETIADDDGEDEDDGEPPGLVFGRMTALSTILSDVLDTFYTLQAIHEIGNAGKEGTRTVLERAKPVQLKLKEWFARLPPCLRMDRARGKNFSVLGG